MSSATKRILSVGVAGILMIIVAFTVGAIIGTDNATTASSALLDMLFVGGVGAIFVGRAYMSVRKGIPAVVAGIGGACGYQTGRQKLIIFLHSGGCWYSSVAFLGTGRLARL